MTDPAGGAVADPVPNIVKTRDDQKPVPLKQIGGSAAAPEFEPPPDAGSAWPKPVTIRKLRERIEPWLTALCQSEHLSLLIGSGVSTALNIMATGGAGATMAPADFGTFKPLIDTEATRAASVAGRNAGNIEDQVRAANDLLRGLEILGANEPARKAEADALRELIAKTLNGLADSVLAGERGLVEADNVKREEAFNYAVSFLMSFASRTGTRDRLHIFTTNYDRYVEAAAELAGLHLLDRFVGTLAPLFRSSRLDLDLHYNPPGIRGEPRYLEGVARFTKLHGSLDWTSVGRDIRRAALPFGAASIAPYLDGAGTPAAKARQLMIYPNAAKDRETASYPYVDLFRDFAAAVCRPNHTLFTVGFSFGDEHITRVIEDMLTIPSTHLVVISYSDTLGRILRTYERLGRHAQITLLVGNHVGDFRALVDNYLPKPAIDKTTFRMAELLKARLSSRSSQATPPPPAPDAVELTIEDIL